MNEDQHIYHHYDNDGARVFVKVEKNTKGFNYEVSVSGAHSVEEALQLIDQATVALQSRFSVPETPPESKKAEPSPAEVPVPAEKTERSSKPKPPKE